jgi:hypothetical protein
LIFLEIKGDVNGRVSGGNSTARMNTPLEFLIKTPDGVEATDFQLGHLHDKSDACEFRTVTGGAFHASGGSSRDRIAVDQTRIAKRTCKVALLRSRCRPICLRRTTQAKGCADGAVTDKPQQRRRISWRQDNKHFCGCCDFASGEHSILSAHGSIHDRPRTFSKRDTRCSNASNIFILGLRETT